MPPHRQKPARLEHHRINHITADSCLAILQYVMPKLAEEPCPAMEGHGIITCAGGRYLRMAYASISRVRELDPTIPVEIWHLPGEDMRGADRFSDLNVTFRDVGPAFGHEGAWVRDGWSAKSHAIKHTSFRNVMFLDADCAPLLVPSDMFETEEYWRTGLLLWPDCQNFNKGHIWPAMGLLPNSVTEHEAGQFLIDRQRQWNTLKLYCWMSGHQFFHDSCFGDKNLLGLAAKKLGMPYSQAPNGNWQPWGAEHLWFDGRPAFHHCMSPKRSPVEPPEYIGKLWREYDSLDQVAVPA